VGTGAASRILTKRATEAAAADLNIEIFLLLLFFFAPEQNTPLSKGTSYFIVCNHHNTRVRLATLT
jgi:hypothetical protein